MPRAYCKHYQEGQLPPVVIVTLMRLRFEAEPFAHRAPPSTLNSLETLVAYGLAIEVDVGCGYALTDRGEAHVEQILRLPFPVESTKWLDAHGEPIPVKGES